MSVRLEEPEEIIPEIPAPGAPTEIGGILDRELARIVVARKLPMLVRRFTIFHEIGHWFVHPNLVYHRDVPVTGVERGNRLLPVEEREANLFAAEALMPRGLVADLFALRYGPYLHLDEIDENLAFKLSLGGSRALSVDELRAMSRRDRSRLIAEDSHAGLPMTEIFAVSVAAMAIRLEELRLVR